MRGGFWLLVCGSILLTIHVWLALGALVPLRRESATEWVFVSATLKAFLVVAALVGVAVMAGHWWLRRAGSGEAGQPALFGAEDVAYARPLLWFGISLLPLVNLAPWLGPMPPVLTYVIVDLRWWWTPACLAWLVARADARLGRRLSGTLAAWCRPWARRGVPEIALAVTVMAWVFFSSPHVRLIGGYTGDEPKYLRAMEALYQGVGFDISEVRPLAELPGGFQPRPWENVALMFRTLPAELRELAADAARFAANPWARFNRARRIDGFVEGRYGGVFQIYNPGMSMLLFPAYCLDRARSPAPPSDKGQQWPDRLPAVNAFLLALHGAWSVLVYRVLRRAVEVRWAAWLAAMTLTMTLPMAGLPFQLYPELTAGVLAAASVGFVLFPGRAGVVAAVGFGVAAGFLPWLHVRFGPLSLLLGGAAAVLLRAEGRRRAWFLAGFVVPWIGLTLYVHRVTGSILPTALWTAEGATPVAALGGIIPASVAYLVDRDWGLFAHSPALIFSAVGYWWMARRHPAVAAVAALSFLSLLLPAASHTLTAAGTTPMRLIGAAVPLAALPLAAWIAQYGRKPAFQALFGLALVLSLDNALRYDLHLVRYGGVFVDTSVSGWKVNLLFPVEARAPWGLSVANGVLFVLWLGLILVPLAVSIRRRGRDALALPWRPTVPGTVIGGLVALAVSGMAVSAAQSSSMQPRYQMSIEEGATRAALLVDRNEHCAICWSSQWGELSTAKLLSILEGAGPKVVERTRPDHVVYRYDEWLAMPGRIREWYIDATGREPAPADVGHYMYQWHEERTPWMEVRRRIYSRAGKEPPDR